MGSVIDSGKKRPQTEMIPDQDPSINVVSTGELTSSKTVLVSLTKYIVKVIGRLVVLV